MSDQYLDLNSIAIIYDGDFLASVPSTYKAFLECLRDKVGLTNEDFAKRTIWLGDFPILTKNDYLRILKTKGKDGIFQIDLVENEDNEDENLFGEKDYLTFLDMKEPEEEIKIKLNEEEKKEESIFIKSDVNEFYAITQVTQYYKNNNKVPIELNIIYPLKREINFRKFTINVNGKKSVSKIFPKEKAEEKYTDALAGGNIGILSKYVEEEPNTYSINIGNVEPDATVELTSEFIQFITSDDMSFCFSVMTNYPTFSDSLSREYSKNINGKICLKTHSKITRLVNKNFTLDKNFKQEFNPEYTECNIEFKVSSESKEYNSILSLLYRTEKMDEPFLLSQYNPTKDETSYIFGEIYSPKQIPIPEKPDTDFETNYYLKYQQQEQKANNPSLFIFLIDQSGSMAGSSMRIVSEAILIFLQSLPKGSYFQLIGFGSDFKKINDKPVEYNKENVKNTMDIIKNLKADLGGTDISSPLKEIFNSKDYDEINLARNLFILTDGEVNNREECLGLINTYSEKFKVHAIGIGSSFDKQLIQNAGIQGRGTYHFVTNVSDVNSIIIESLSKCLRDYVLNAKITLNELKPEHEFTPKMNFIYPDEILNYYFILKGKDHDKIQINFENPKKTENYIFTKEKLIKEEDGEIVSQIIVGNKLKNDEKMEEEIIIKLSKDYQILSKKTSLFAVAENEENNKIGELKQITKKQKKSHYDNMIMGNNANFVNSMNNVNFMQNIDKNVHYDMPRNYGLANNNLNMNMQMPLGFGMMGSRPNRHFDLMENNSRPLAMKSMAFQNCSALEKDSDSDNDDKKCKKAKRSSPLMKAKEIRYEKSKRMEEDNEYLGNNFEAGDDDGDIEYDMMKESNANEDRYEEGNALKINLGKNDEEEEKEVKKESEKEEKKEEKKVEFSNKELVLTQDIFDGCWNLNPQTQLLIEKEKSVYDKIEQILKEKNIEKEEVKITMLVLYYLNTNDSINKVEYMLIIKKGISFLEENGIKFDEVLPSLKN